MAKHTKAKCEPIEVGTCFAMPQADGRFSACQVLAPHKDGGHEVIALDWLGEAAPTLADLEGVSVLILNHHSWQNTPQRMIVSDAPPAEFVSIGVSEPLATFDEDPRTYGAWLGLSGRILAELWWNEVAPKAETSAYNDALKHRRDKFTFELGGITHEAQRGLAAARVGPDEPFRVAADQELDWSALDALGMLSKIQYTGSDRGVLDYVASRVLVKELHWSAHGQRTIDLSDAGVGHLVLEVGDGSLELHLPADQAFVSLTGYRGQDVTVRHPGNGAGLHLMLHDLSDATPPPIGGLEALSMLSLMAPKELDIAELGYPRLARIAIKMKNGHVTHLGALAELQHLERLRIGECYEMEPEHFPEPSALPNLESVTFHSLRKRHAAVLKKRLKGLPNLSITGAKTDAWLAGNAGNPFNDWVDESAKLGKAACKIYKESHGKVLKLRANDTEAYHREMVDFVRAFNRLGTKHSLDTIHREHIFTAFHELATASPVEATKAVLAEWFDEDREF